MLVSEFLRPNLSSAVSSSSKNLKNLGTYNWKFGNLVPESFDELGVVEENV